MVASGPRPSGSMLVSLEHELLSGAERRGHRFHVNNDEDAFNVLLESIRV